MKRRSHRRGFTIILAVILLGLIAVAAAMVVHQLGYELQRTRTAYEDAQLRQLLLAGAQEVAAHTEQLKSQKQPMLQKVDLPKSLQDEGATLSITKVKSTDPANDVTITARFGAREASQTLHWEPSSSQWTVSPPAE